MFIGAAIPYRWTHDRRRRTDQALRPHRGRRPPELRGDPGRGHRVPGAQRVGQVDDHAHDHGARQPDVGDGPGQRQAVRRAPVAAARGGRAPRCQGLPPGPERLRPSAVPGPVQRHPPRPRSTRCSTSWGSPRWPTSGPASTRSAWGSASGSPPRCSGIPGVLLFDEPINGLDPEGHPLGPLPAARPGRRGADRVRLQPPDQRDGPHGRATGGDRPGHPDRRDERERRSPPRARSTPCAW